MTAMELVEKERKVKRVCPFSMSLRHGEACMDMCAWWLPELQLCAMTAIALRLNKPQKEKENERTSYRG